MHSAHRDLENKYKRVLTELINVKRSEQILTDTLVNKNKEMVDLKSLKQG
jgi:hypothetical protein